MHVSHNVYLPVDLAGGLFAEGHIRCPTTGTDSLVVWYVVDHFDGLKGRVVPSAMPWAPGLLTSTTFLTCDIIFASSRLDWLAPLRGGTKDELGERRHLLGKCTNLAFELAYSCQ